MYQLGGFLVSIYNALINLLLPSVRSLATIAPSQQLFPHPDTNHYRPHKEAMQSTYEYLILNI